MGCAATSSAPTSTGSRNGSLISRSPCCSLPSPSGCHLTHGAVEYGTDFIAKKVEDGPPVQYSFQVNAAILPWLLGETRSGARLNPRSRACPIHTSIRTGAPSRSRHDGRANPARLGRAAAIQRGPPEPVRDTTGAGVDQAEPPRVPARYGLNGVHRATAGGFGEFGRFFLTYSHALQGVITVQEIERYSRQWADADIDPEQRLLLAAIESEVLAQQCLAHDLVYEAIQFHLARLRLLCDLAYADGAVPSRELWDGAVAQLHAVCADYIGRVREAWAGDKDLCRPGPATST